MGQRKKRHERCPACQMHIELCFCAEVPTLESAARVVMVMHRRELYKPTNTGRLALLSLSDIHLELRGDIAGPMDLTPHQSPERRSLVLFPREDAVLLDQAFLDADPRPVTLFVPDGTWAQARRAVRRDEILRNATAIQLAPGPPSRYRLRREHLPEGLATAEALARALRVIDGPAVADALESLFDTLVASCIASRSHRKP